MAPTGMLEIISPGKTETLTWNGIVEEREAARAAFEKAVRTGYFFASVVDSPGKSHQVRTFAEVEDVEKERGVVSVRIHPSIQGG